MNSVFVLWYVVGADTDDEDELLIGVYSAQKEAEAAIERLKGQLGFVDAPKGFQISEYELNRDHWTEGFRITDD